MRTAKKTSETGIQDAVTPKTLTSFDLFKSTYPVELNGVEFLIISPFISQYDKMAILFAKIQSNFDLKSFFENELWGLNKEREPQENSRKFASDELYISKTSGDLLLQPNIDMLNLNIDKLDSLIAEISNQTAITPSEINDKALKIAFYEQKKKKISDMLSAQYLLSYVEKNTNDVLDLLSVFMVKKSTYDVMVKDKLDADFIVKETKQALSLINSMPTLYGLSKLVFEVNVDFFTSQIEIVMPQIVELLKKAFKTPTQSSTKSNS